MAFIDQKELFEKTDGGRLVIEQYYPQSVDCFANPKRKFKTRTSEKTASSSLKQVEDGIWLVTDFGDDSKPRNAIQVVMHEEGLDFGAAINLIAAQFHIVPEAQRLEIFKPEIRKKDAEPDQKDGEWQFKTKEFTIKELKTILAPKVWDYLVYSAKAVPAEEQEAKILEEVSAVFARYHFHSLEHYIIIKDRKAIEIRSTDIFPIFMFDEKEFKKIYKPREVLAANRFMYYNGKGPSDFLFGYQPAHKAYDELMKIEDGEVDEEEEAAAKKKKKKKKLQNLFLVSGGSDALNLAVIGQCFKKYKEADVIAEMYFPVWMNSETAILTTGQMKNLQSIAVNVFNIPDIDITGKKQAHKLATDYLELRTIYLPEELKTKTDSFRKKPKKDLKDYFNHYKVYDFFNLIKTAYPYRFWDVNPKFNKDGEFVKYEYAVNNKHLYNFLARNGFYRYETESEKDGYFYIKIDGNIVRKIEPKRIRDFINVFIETRNPDVELMNTFLRTNQLNETSLSNLPFIKIDFADFDKETQWMFFLNATYKVTKDAITEYKPGEVEKFVWEEEVINHKVKKLPDFFTVAPHSNIQTRQLDFDLTIHNNDCLILRYLTNTSRIFWREELENRLEGIEEKEQDEYKILHRFTKEDEHLMNGLPKAEWEEYRKKNQYEIAGPLLTERERHEQAMHLINKLFGVGFVFHRHREAGKAWSLWGMDAKNSDGNESHGGSGKSLLANLIHSQKLMRSQYREGRNKKLTENPHFWEGCDKHTDLLIVDDCYRYMDFGFFFSSIGGPINVNPKNNKQFTIDASDAPKIWFTSNFPPHDVDISTERRIIYMLYSDYYHYSRMDEYRENRSVLDEFGKNFGNEFTEHEWNMFLNLLMQCIKFYLNCTAKINPPMENVNKRNLKSTMGEAFEPWADVYFSDESGRLDILVVKDEAVSDYLKSTNLKGHSTNKFTKSLQAWCYYHGYELNPKELKNKGGRIIKQAKVPDGQGGTRDMAKEHIYIKTKSVMEGVVDRFNKRVAEQEAGKADTKTPLDLDNEEEVAI